MSKGEAPPQANDDEDSWRAAWGLLIPPFRGTIGRLCLFTAGAALQSATVLPSLLLVRLAFDRAVPAGDVRLLLGIGVALVALRAAGSVMMLAIRGRTVRLIRTATLKLRRALLADLYAGSPIAQAQTDKAVLHSRLVIETERIDNMADALLSGSLPAVVTCVVLLGTLFALNPLLVLLAAGIVPLLWFGGRISGRRMKADILAFQQAFEAFGRGMRAVLDHLPLTRARAAEAWETARQDTILTDLRNAAVRMSDGSARHSQLQANLLGLPGVVILIVGGVEVAHGGLTLGGLLAFYMAAGLLNGQIDRLAGAVPTVIAGHQSLVTLLRLRRGFGRAPYAGTATIAWSGEVTLDRIGFAYSETEVLRDVSLRLRPGDRAAIIGPNGAGKSTLLNLVMGFYRPQTGRLLADGVEYDQLDMQALRRGIGFVPQHPTLFGGTVFENIAYGRPDATREEAMEAVRRASAEALLARLPDGLDTRVGEGGALLSGGEGQLLALARAQIGDPRLLILDEPTNHLDQPTIRRLMLTLTDRPNRPAILLISHDPAVIEHAGVVWRLECGQLRELEHPLPNLAGALA